MLNKLNNKDLAIIANMCEIDLDNLLAIEISNKIDNLNREEIYRRLNFVDKLTLGTLKSCSKYLYHKISFKNWEEND